jgi:hypothetical protein
MISEKEKEYIYYNSYIPEHVVDYVTSITGGEPFLFEDHVYYVAQRQLFFVGYPLKKTFDQAEMNNVIDMIVRKVEPDSVSLISPGIERMKYDCARTDSDNYYRLDLISVKRGQKTRNMINRASKELDISVDHEITDEHIKLIGEFVESHPVDEERKFIFENIPKYGASDSSAKVFNAIDKNDRLIAFDIAEFGSKEYAFYMFNFRSKDLLVPGASDLLLNELIKTAVQEGKTYLNLGLGMSEGNRFFKKKWGGTAFFDYKFCQYSLSKKEGLLSLFMKF